MRSILTFMLVLLHARGRVQSCKRGGQADAQVVPSRMGRMGRQRSLVVPSWLNLSRYSSWFLLYREKLHDGDFSFYCVQDIVARFTNTRSCFLCRIFGDDLNCGELSSLAMFS